MILGIGIDLCKISRINSTLYKFGDRFKKRCFTYNEINKCDRVKNSSACYAKRFASKEAVSKALGTGFRKGVYWKDLEVVNLPSGKPSINFYGNSKKQLESLIPRNNIPVVNLSITDEFPYAQAIVTINSNKV